MPQFKPKLKADVQDVVEMYDKQLVQLNDMMEDLGVKRIAPPASDGPPPFPENVYDLSPSELGRLQSKYQRWLEYYAPEATFARTEERVAQEILRAVESIVFTTLTGTVEDRKHLTRFDKRLLYARKRTQEAELKAFGIQKITSILEQNLKLLSRTIELRKLEFDNFWREQHAQSYRHPRAVAGNINPMQPQREDGNNEEMGSEGRQRYSRDGTNGTFRDG